MNKWMVRGLALLVALTILGVGACTFPWGQVAPPPAGQGEPGPIVGAVKVQQSEPAADGASTPRSQKQRVTSPDVPASDQAGLVHGNSAFAFDLYQALREQDGNLFYSPHSISIALAITYAGARGETQRQMADTLHFLPQGRVHPAFNALDLNLAGRSKDENRFQLNIINALWGQKDYVFLESFLDLLGENYGAGIRTLDFKRAPVESRNTINDWVSDQTEGKINDLVPESAINQLTRLILTNAIYFDAAWLNPFDKSGTENGTFYPIGRQGFEVPMMRQSEKFGYLRVDGYQAVELPYAGGELSMIILLPDASRFDEFEAALDAQTVRTVSTKLMSQEVALTMPKFEFESDFSLVEILSQMGMPDAFSPEPGVADFSGMTGNRDLRIGAVVHKAFVAVDEEGTEAAAATAVAMEQSLSVSRPVQVVVDHPFVFLIRDIESGSILFIGRVVDPRS